MKILVGSDQGEDSIIEIVIFKEAPGWFMWIHYYADELELLWRSRATEV